MKLVGRHNYMNASGGQCVGFSLSIQVLPQLDRTCKFTGLAHRFQLAYQKDDVRWINDSKATNVGSTVAALTGLYVADKLHLLLGGDGKSSDFFSQCH